MNERRGGWRGSRALAVGGLSALALACAASSSTAQEVAGTGDAAYQPSQPDYGGQFGIGVIATDRFAALSPREPVPLIRFLTEGTAIRAETRSSAEVVLFVARASRGKLVSKGQTRPFRLDAKAASTSSGMRLG